MIAESPVFRSNSTKAAFGSRDAVFGVSEGGYAVARRNPNHWTPAERVAENRRKNDLFKKFEDAREVGAEFVNAAALLASERIGRGARNHHYLQLWRLTA